MLGVYTQPARFSKAYITKIVNQVAWAAKQMQGKDWEFRVAKWDEVLPEAQPDDFVYMDPPYIGRHADYYNSWDQADAERLALVAKELSCGFALSMWLQNRYRKNVHVENCWSELDIRAFRHFYHVGSTESLRNRMDEGLIIKSGFATPDGEQETEQPAANQQLSLEVFLQPDAVLPVSSE